MAWGPIGSLPILEIKLGGLVIGETGFERFAKSQRMGRIIVDVTVRQRAQSFISSPKPRPIASGPILDFPAAGGPTKQSVFTFADGPWFGRPKDTLRPNKAADPRVSVSADIERVIPLSPETSRRGTVSIGNFEFINTDNGISELLTDFSVGDQQIRIFYGPANGDFSEFKLIGEVFGDQLEATADVIRLNVKSTAAYLDRRLWSRKYGGTGGLDGDLNVSGKIVPQTFGDCFNVTPVLMDSLLWIYQVHDGPILAVDAFKERLVPFDYIGDFEDYDALVAAVVDTGQYATCLQLGLIRSQFAPSPAGPVTADVRGDLQAGIYTDRMGDILLRIALNQAAMPESYLSVTSFNALPVGAVGFYTDGQDYSVSDLFDKLLGSINGWYGSDRSKLLRVGFIEAPQNKPSSFTISAGDILKVERISLPQPPRYQQTVTYRQNFTPMSDSDVSLALPADVRAAGIRVSTPITQTSAGTRLRERSAIIGGDIATYFRDEADALSTLQRVMGLFSETGRAQYRVTMPRTGYLINLCEYGDVQVDRMGLDAGIAVVVIAMKDSGQTDQVELTVWG